MDVLILDRHDYRQRLAHHFFGLVAEQHLRTAIPCGNLIVERASQDGIVGGFRDVRKERARLLNAGQLCRTCTPRCP